MGKSGWEAGLGCGRSRRVREVLPVRERWLGNLGEPRSKGFRLKGRLVRRSESGVCCLILVDPDGCFVPGLGIEVVWSSGCHRRYRIGYPLVKAPSELYHDGFQVAIL